MSKSRVVSISAKWGHDDELVSVLSGLGVTLPVAHANDGKPYHEGRVRVDDILKIKERMGHRVRITSL